MKTKPLNGLGLVSLLDLPQIERREVFERRFFELFSIYPHAATFSALADLALEGAQADDLWFTFELNDETSAPFMKQIAMLPPAS